MAAVEVLQTLEYRGGQLNVAPVPEVENFTNWKKWFMCYIIADERKAANLDQRFKSLIMFVLPDDQINSVINCLTAKLTWDDLIVYHKGPYDVKESRVMDLKLSYNTFKFKEGESLTQTFTRYKALINMLVNDGIKLSKIEINIGFINGLPKKWLNFCQSLRNTNHVKDYELASLFGKLKYEENLIDIIYETKKNKSLVSTTPLSTSFFSTSIVHDFQDSPDDEEDIRSSHEYLNDLEEEYQVRSLLAMSKRFFRKGTQRFSSAKATDQTECYKYGKKGHFARDCCSSASNPSSPTCKNKGLFAETYDWDDEEVSSDENEVKDLMALTDKKEFRLAKKVLEMHVHTEILKENQNLRLELKELTSITETWLNSSNKVNQCINEQIPTQKKKILGINQLTEDTSSFGSKDPVFIKSSADNSDMSITSSNIPKSSETEDSNLPNQDTDEAPSNESQRNTTDPSVIVSDSSITDYDSTDESLVCSTPLLSLNKLDGAEPISGPKTIKSILMSKSTFKAETLKGITINEPSLNPARGKSSSASKTNSAPVGKLKNVKIEYDPPLAIVMKELNELNLQINKKKSSYFRNKMLNGTNHRTCDHAEFMSSMNTNQHYTGQGESSSRSRPSRPLVSFPSCIHCGYNDHHSNDCLYYPTCEICGSYDYDTHGYNRIISLRKGINPRNPQHVTKNYETCGSNVHTISDHNDIEWFRKEKFFKLRMLSLSKQVFRSLNYYPLQMEDTSAHDTIPTLFSKGGIWHYIHKLGPDLNGKAICATQLRGTKPGAQTRHKNPLTSSKQPSVSSKEASISQTGQSKKETKSSLAKDKSPSHPSPLTPVVGEMHKEAQQAASGPTSLITSNI
ncbi:retrovirus-related pol polyprotein from transposon TNT 1-94 [Tanacetum coccineum]